MAENSAIEWTDRPIIFSALMVRALLAGTKTQTRRLLKPQPRRFEVAPGEPCEMTLYYGEDEPWPRITLGRVITGQQVRFRPGMKLWVRENWKPVPASAYRCSDGVQQTPNPNDPDLAAVYSAGWDRSTGGTPWRPSIHMPRWASRLTLTVTDVRVQRLQDISEADAAAEGVPPFNEVGRIYPDPYRVNFGLTWNSLHGPDAWAGNPEIVALTFTVDRKNIDA